MTPVHRQEKPAKIMGAAVAEEQVVEHEHFDNESGIGFDVSILDRDRSESKSVLNQEAESAVEGEKPVQKILAEKQMPELKEAFIFTEDIGEFAVTESRIAPHAISASKLAPGAIGSEAIQDYAITSVHLAEGTITSGKIAPLSISGEHIVDGSLSTRKLRDNSINTSKIKDSSITSQKLADRAVTGTKSLTAALPPVISANCLLQAKFWMIKP